MPTGQDDPNHVPEARRPLQGGYRAANQQDRFPGLGLSSTERKKGRFRAAGKGFIGWLKPIRAGAASRVQARSR